MLKIAFFTFLIFISFIAVAQVDQPETSGKMLSQLKNENRDTLRIKTLQSLLQFYIKKRGYLKVNLDSAINYGQQSISLSDSLHRTDLKDRSLIWMGEVYLKFLDYEKGKAYYLQAINDFHLTGQGQKETRALLVLAAKSLYYKLMRPELLDFSKRALTIAEQSGDRSGMMNGHMITGALYEKSGLLDSASVHLLKALTIAKVIGGEDAFKVYVTLSYLYRDKGDDASALAYSSAALKDLQDRHVSEKSPKYADITLDMASAYEAFDRKQAIVYYKAAMRYALINKDEGGMDHFYDALEGLANVMCFDHEGEKAMAMARGYTRQYPPLSDFEKAKVAVMYAVCYKALEKNDLAEKNFLKAIDLYKNDPTRQLATKAALARFYSDIKQFKKTEMFLKDPSPVKNSLPFMNRVWEEHQRYQLDSAKGNYLSALDHYRRYKAMNDTFYTDEKTKQIAALQIKYQTKEREQAFKLLKSVSTSQRSDLQRVKLQKNITLGGIGLLLLVSGLVVYGYSQKQRSNRLLTAQKNEIDKKNESLENLNVTQQKLLTEKDWLLKEVHHRVKNNLQIVMSLLNTQSAYLQNNDALTAIRESQNRVQSISLIHQKLYSTSNVASIDIVSYSCDLINYLRDCFDTDRRSIRFEQVIEPVQIDLAQAVPIGLILNEAITNSVKYAFPEKGGEIMIGMQLLGDDRMLLTVADNGKGLPDDFDFKAASSLGMEMMKALSKQLGGTFEIKGNNGTRISIEFQLEKVLINPLLETIKSGHE